ncbi:MAG: hypothetical protein GYB68_14735 [Chloroflexi bacterium]|nr:hypothetical protein [Chloroflexota bacterium]
MIRTPWPLLLITLALFVVGCGSSLEEDMGELPADGTPMSFTARGDTIHLWTAEVEVGQEYVVRLEDLGALLDVCTDPVFYACDGLLRLGIDSTLDGGAEVTFTSPTARIVFIHVRAAAGARAEELGVYRIQLAPTD